jgi:hypothetical protein
MGKAGESHTWGLGGVEQAGTPREDRWRYPGKENVCDGVGVSRKRTEITLTHLLIDICVVKYLSLIFLEEERRNAMMKTIKCITRNQSSNEQRIKNSGQNNVGINVGMLVKFKRN